MCRSPSLAGGYGYESPDGLLGWQKIGGGRGNCADPPALPGAMDMKALTGFFGGIVTWGAGLFN